MRHIVRASAVAVSLLGVAVLTGGSEGIRLGGRNTAPLPPVRTLSWAERLEAQRAVEGVFYAQRLRYAETSMPGTVMPPFEEAVPEALLQKHVDEALLKSQLLEQWWQRPLEAQQLQAEMERMAAQSKDHDTLRKVFEALGNDPSLIAETLGREALADRLARNWYAFDERFHGALKQEAHALRARLNAGNFRALGGENYSHAFLAREGSEAERRLRQDARDWKTAEAWPVTLAEGEWEAWRRSFPPQGGISEVEETRDAFVIRRTVLAEDDMLEAESIVLHKRSFDEWFEEQKAAARPEELRRPGGASPGLTDAGENFGFELPILEPGAAPAAYGTPGPDKWVQIWDSPAPRIDHTAIWTGNEMVVWGGYDSSAPLQTGARYTPATDTWTPTSVTNAPAGRYNHTAVWTGSVMVIWAGYGEFGCLQDGSRYDPGTDSWAVVNNGGSPIDVFNHTAVWTGREMIVWGGKGDGCSEYIGYGGRYNPATDVWTSMSFTGAPSGRVNHTAVWTGERMIIWGGLLSDCNGIGDCPSANDGAMYSPGADTWSAVTLTGAPQGRFSHTAVWTGSEMVVWGGIFEGTYLNTGGRYNPSTNTWAAVTTTGAPEARTYHTAVWTGERMIVWGGVPSTNTGGRYVPSTNTWAATTTTGAPAARYGHSAVWTGSEMVVWGGTSGSEVNTGGRYDPAANTWLATGTGTAPETRGQHSLVWTGSEMIAWGGAVTSGGTNTGGRYVPATDVWTATTTVNAPSARFDHTAIWTGTEMIVWGGAGYLNTGGRYVPGGAWTATDTATAPTGRTLHGAVWTGTEMIVWGGYTAASAQTNTGGRYVPGGAWTATDTATAPLARSEHTQVWTGTEMIVWGGFRSDVFTNTNTGGRYVPGGTWTAITTTGAPSARRNHVGVWAGAELFIWSGGPPAVNTGGRYVPGGAWTATTLTGVPSARYAEGGLWTGKNVVIWGGTEGLVGINTGTKYAPSPESWTAITTQNAPAPRWGVHMTGGPNFALVWGGQYQRMNDGGIFYPNTAPRALPDIVNTADSIVLGQGLDLQLNGAASTTGSNPSTSTPNQDSYDSLASYEWDLNDDGFTDLTGSAVSLPEANLGIYGLDYPGTYPISLKVTDSAGLTNTASVTLMVLDGTYPFVEVASPNGGETLVEGTVWPISWNGGDNIGLDHYEVYYTPNYCMDMTGDPDAGSVLVAKGSGGDDGTKWTYSNDFWRGGAPPSLWHIEAACAPSGSGGSASSFRYGVSGNCASFATGGERNGGWLVSPRMESAGSAVTLSFSSRRDTEMGGPGCGYAYDRAAVYVRSGAPAGAALSAPSFPWGGAPPVSVNGWSLVAEICDEGGVWAPKSYDVSSLVGGKSDIYVGFVFDSIDGAFNTYLGWMVDDVRLTCNLTWTPINMVVAPNVNTLNWTVPNTLSANCRARVVAEDVSGNQSEDISDSDFYIVQATTSGVKTLIVTYLPRMETLWPNSTASLDTKLQELAANEKVAGVILRLENVPSVVSAYSAWDAAKTDQGKANAAAAAVRSYLVTQLSTVYTQAEHVVLVGDDRIIPFYRIPDGVSIYSESQYTGELNCGSTAGSALCQNYFLSDNYYADLASETTGAGQGVIYLPDYGIGRLVESPGQIEATVNTFIAQDGQVDLGTVFVSGYDFLNDGAAHMRDAWTGAGETVSWLLGQGWTPGDLQTEIFAIPDTVNVINSHDDHHSFGTPNGPLSTAAMAADPGMLTGSVFYNIGCHSGLTVPSTDPNPLDVPETLMTKGVAAFVGNTGFGWGLRQGVGLSERLNEILTEEIIAMNEAPLGLALKAAKRRYYQEDHRFDVFDEKVLQEAVLFGLPMYTVVVDPAGGSGGGLDRPEIRRERQAQLQAERMKGIGEERSEIPALSLPPGVTGLDLSFTFGPGTHQLVSTPDGDYYELNGESSGEVGDAIQPLFIYDSLLSGTVSHGTLFTGGTYTGYPGFNPTVGAPVSNNTDNGEGPLPQMGTFVPAMNPGDEGLTATCVSGEIHYDNLTVHTGYLLPSGEERIFDQMNFSVYYSNFCDVTPPAVTDPGPGGAHTMDGYMANFSVQVTDADSSIFRVLVTYTANAGSWNSLDLAYNAGTGMWEGSMEITAAVDYFIQAVDAAGNTAVLSLTGGDLNALGQPYGSQYSAAKIFNIPLPPGPCTDAYEPNGAFGSAAPIVADTLYDARICSAADEDYYALTLPASGALSVMMAPPSGLNYDLYLYDGSQALIASSTKGGSQTEFVTKAAAAGTYYVRVKGADAAQFSLTALYSLLYFFDADPPPPCAAPDEEVYIYVATLDGNGNVVLHFMDPNQPADVTGYNVYRSGSPTGPWTLIGSNVVDMDAGTPNLQFVDTSGEDCGGTCYFEVAAYNGPCALEGPR